MKELENTHSEGGGGFWKETGRFFVLVFGSALIIRLFIATPFIVSGESMYPTFSDKEYLVVDKLSYRIEEPARGDVIVFQYPNDPSKFFIKRVIGLPGETVSGQNGKVTVKRTDGTTVSLSEPYVREPFFVNFSAKLDGEHYFVMGDNRNESSDSRQWGPLDRSLLTGRAILRLYPLGRLTLFPGEARPEAE